MRVLNEITEGVASPQTIKTDNGSRLDDAQIANAAVNQVGDLRTHRQLHTRQRFHAIGSPAGELQALLPPATINSFDARMDPVPGLGEHSESLLRELGCSDADIEQLRGGGESCPHHTLM